MPTNPAFRWQRQENHKFQASLGNIMTVFLSPRETKKVLTQSLIMSEDGSGIFEDTLTFNNPPPNTNCDIPVFQRLSSTAVSRSEAINPLHGKSMCLGLYSKKMAPFSFGDRKVPFQL